MAWTYLARVRRDELLQQLQIAVVQQQVLVAADRTRIARRDGALAHARLASASRCKRALVVAPVLLPHRLNAVRLPVGVAGQIAEALLQRHDARSIERIRFVEGSGGGVSGRFLGTTQRTSGGQRQQSDRVLGGDKGNGRCGAGGGLCEVATQKCSILRKD